MSFKKNIILGLFLSVFSFSLMADEIDDLLDNKEGLSAEELTEKINQKRNELWQKYLEEKKMKDTPKVSDEGQVSNGLSQGEQDIQVKGQPPFDYNQGSNVLKQQNRYACIVIGNIKGGSIDQKTNYTLHSDSLGAFQLNLVIDSAEDLGYINDGTGTPYLRVKPNVFQRNLTFVNGNELFDTWIIDTKNKKAMFSQLKTGADFGNSMKSMTGDLISFKFSKDCK